MPSRSERNENLKNQSYFPVSRIAADRGLEKVTGVRSTTDISVFNKYQSEIEKKNPSFWQGLGLLSQIRLTAGSIHSQDAYATGMLVYFASFTEHAKRNNFTTPKVQFDDFSSLLVEDASSKLHDPEKVEQILLRLYANTNERIDWQNPQIPLGEKFKRVEKRGRDLDSKAQALIFDPRAEENIAALTELATGLNQSLQERKEVFTQSEEIFVGQLSRRWGVDLAQMVEEITFGATDCKKVLQLAIARVSPSK